MVTRAEQLSQEFIWGRLDASSDAVEAALVAIYERQTLEERAGRYSVLTNSVGFNKFDAEFCTSLVVQIQRGRHLTPRQLPHARKKMKRYWRQLITIQTTHVPEPMVDNDEPILAPSIRAQHLPGAAPVPERAHELYASW